jgi:hypothetical protein
MPKTVFILLRTYWYSAIPDDGLIPAETCCNQILIHIINILCYHWQSFTLLLFIVRTVWIKLRVYTDLRISQVLHTNYPIGSYVFFSNFVFQHTGSKPFPQEWETVCYPHATTGTSKNSFVKYNLQVLVQWHGNIKGSELNGRWRFLNWTCF